MTEHPALETVRRYVSCAQDMDFAGRKALWDRDEALPILCPEECDEPLIGWDALDTYWSRSRASMSELRAKAVNFRVNVLADDIVLVTYDSRWIASMAGMDEPAISADVRMNALLRKKPEGWRYFQLVEGPVDLMTMSRQAARRSALERFPELGSAR